MSAPHKPDDETRIERAPQAPVPDPGDLDSTRWDADNVDPAGPPVEIDDDAIDDDDADDEREPGLTTRWDGPLEPPPPPPPESGKTTRWVKRPGDAPE